MIQDDVTDVLTHSRHYTTFCVGNGTVYVGNGTVCVWNGTICVGNGTV